MFFMCVQNDLGEKKNHFLLPNKRQKIYICILHNPKKGSGNSNIIMLPEASYAFLHNKTFSHY